MQRNYDFLSVDLERESEKRELAKREKLFYPSSRQFIGNTYRSDFYTISINYSMRMRTMHIQFQSVYTHLHFSICQYTLEVSWIRNDHIKKDMYVNMGLKIRRYNLIKLKCYAFPFYLSFQMRRINLQVEDGQILVEIEVFRWFILSRLILWQVNRFQDYFLNTVMLFLR